jgi:N-acetylmuramoyl-L-alanine amidase
VAPFRIGFRKTDKEHVDSPDTEADGESSLPEEVLSRDFFELEPEEVSSYEPPAPKLAQRSWRRLKTVAGVLTAVLLVGGLVTAFVLLWPSSRVSVPDLVGKILGDAIETARRSGLSPRVEGWAYSGKHSDGVVLSQRPRGRMVVTKGSEVSLTLSKGPDTESGDLTGSVLRPGQAQSSSATASPFAGKTVCVDPGHQVIASQGEWVDPGMTKRSPPDNGGQGTVTGNHEYILTMDIAGKLRSLLEKDGINVIMTRESGGVDLTNVTRAEIANRGGADLLVSVHLGYSEDANAKGTTTLYPANTQWTAGFYEKSKTAALYIQADTAQSCGTTDLGAHARDDMPLFNWSQVPVTEVLVAYLSNADEDRLLATDEFRWKAAWGIRNGIIKYLRSP